MQFAKIFLYLFEAVTLAMVPEIYSRPDQTLCGAPV